MTTRSQSLLSTLATTVVVLALGSSVPVQADIDVHPWAEDVGITGSGTRPGEVSPQPTPDSAGGGPGPAEYRWRPACNDKGTQAPVSDCVGALRCPERDETLWTLWGRAPSGQGWIALSAECRGDPPPGAPPKPTLTPGDVLEAARRIGLPSLQVQIQPEDETLVNFATIFYAEPETFERTVTLLGFAVDVRAEPSSYRWVFGDGQVATTSEPGAPYPAKDVTHKYADAHVTVHPRVDVTYQVQYRVDGGAWQSLEETLTAQGPATSLRIKEATPVLSGGD